MCYSKVCLSDFPSKASNPSPEQPMLRRLSATLLLSWVVAAPITGAQESGADPSVPEPPAVTRTYDDTFSGRIRGLFDVDLPRFDPPGTYRLQFNPRLGDLFRRDYIRVPIGLRWTSGRHVELSGEAEAYFTHDRSPGDPGHGIGELRFGGRYLLPKWPRDDLDTSMGLNVEIPVGSPPLDLTDGRNHFSPNIVVEHHSAKRPRWTTFGGLSADIVTDSSVPGQRLPNTPRDDSVSLTGGAVYDLGQVKWAVQATYTNSLLGGVNEHIFTVRPSVLWFLPREYTLNSKTQWVVGFGIRGTWGPDGFDLSTGTRVRAEITFRQAMDRLRGAMNYSR